MRIGLDVMGGDYAPKATVAGAVLAMKELHRGSVVVLIGDKKKIQEELKKLDAPHDKYEIIHAPDTIGMAESPIKAFTQKPHSSIAIGYHLLMEKKIHAFASAGNTGAMLVGAMYSVKTIPGVIRPCLTSMVPKESGKMGVLLDVGANADCKPDVLYQFGILGSLYAEHVYGIKNPKIGLMNLGEEGGKGNLVSQSAYAIMKTTKQFHFIGNIEGCDLFNPKADVIVCEGFTGNVIIKQAESIYKIMLKRHMINSSDSFFNNFNYEIHGGSPILGINGAVVIGHGISNELAIKNMLMLSKNVAETKLSEKIKNAFEYV
ncbi:MAG: phosphate acyltransferase PlsX [Bacteroidetes bacterium]|nr:phosphate acyltransferase PlsX [Bacteroidota bacterium]